MKTIDMNFSISDLPVKEAVFHYLVVRFDIYLYFIHVSGTFHLVYRFDKLDFLRRKVNH